MQRLFLAAAFVLIASPAFSQWVVFDPSTFGQAVAIVQQVQSQYALWQQMATGLATVGGYRMPGLNAPLMVPRTLGAPVLLPPLTEEQMAWIAPQQTALQDRDARLTATLDQMQRIQAFTAAITSRLSNLGGDITGSNRTMQGSLDAISAAEFVRANQAERQHAIDEARFDLEVQRELRDRDAQARDIQWRGQQMAAPPMDIGADLYVNGWLR